MEWDPWMYAMTAAVSAVATHGCYRGNGGKGAVELESGNGWKRERGAYQCVPSPFHPTFPSAPSMTVHEAVSREGWWPVGL